MCVRPANTKAKSRTCRSIRRKVCCVAVTFPARRACRGKRRPMMTPRLSPHPSWRKFTSSNAALSPTSTRSSIAESANVLVTPGLCSPISSGSITCAITTVHGPNGATKSARQSKRALKSEMSKGCGKLDEAGTAETRSDETYPAKLNKIINLFESLPEDERRETLVSYADNAKKQEPREGENFNLVDVRKDEECMDTVGVYLHVEENGKAHIRMTLGPEVQTLTRAMTAVLCKGLEGCTPQEILDLPSDFVTRIVGAELVRIRSQTINYVLTRIKSICKVYLDRQRMAQVA